MSFQQEFNKILGTMATMSYVNSQTPQGKQKVEKRHAKQELAKGEHTYEKLEKSYQKELRGLSKKYKKDKEESPEQKEEKQSILNTYQEKYAKAAEYNAQISNKLYDLDPSEKNMSSLLKWQGEAKTNQGLSRVMQDSYARQEQAKTQNTNQFNKDYKYLNRLDSMLNRQDQVKESREQIKNMKDRIEQGKALGQEIEAAEKLLQAKKAEEPKKETPKPAEAPKKETAPAEKKEEPKKEEPKKEESKPTPSPSEPVAVRRTEVRARSFAEAEQKLKEIDAKGGKS